MNYSSNSPILSDGFVQENPRHLKYVNEFRTKQCTRFQDHKCAFHKPFNCFDWHFPNQKRRIPVLKEDGTFNYNPDLYCNDYDSNTGQCINGINCQYVHLNAGDTERRYHPRYYKTGMCIYETTSDGICGKNGIHCAFAHEQSDLRQAVLDIRESSNFTNNLSAQLEKDRVLFEDPIWNSMDYVLAFYKTKECKKLPKTCRQGYACPFYHNSKDKRRLFDVFQYQSQPCTYLKPNNDEWQDVAFCQMQENCKFSHSRTEQQFHPEIFKSSKCNDMIRDGQCPRGPFCAFAHNDEEMNSGQYLAILKDCIFKIANFNCSELSSIFKSSSPCLSDSRSLTSNVFPNDAKPHVVWENYSSLIPPKLFSTNKNNSLIESQCKDISSNLKQILERALSDSCNVSQMSDIEIQRLPDLLMKFSNGDNSLNEGGLSMISEWKDQEKIDESFDKMLSKVNEKVENIKVGNENSPDNKLISKQLNDRSEKILLHKEILDTKFRLKRAEEDLENTKNQIQTILIQLHKFMDWLKTLAIDDNFKMEINKEISVILEKLENISRINENCSD